MIPFEANVWTDPQIECPCVSRHVPKPVGWQRHHIQPLAWGGPDSDDNTVYLCATTHSNVHYLLREWRGQDGEPPWSFRQLFSSYTRDLAEDGFNRWVAAGRP